MSDPEHSDSVITNKAQTVGDLIWITKHPAFRIGYLDARAGRPMDHDAIIERIFSETPAGALKRLGWKTPELFDVPDMFSCDSALRAKAAKSVEIAQYRYEEGRQLFIEYGVRCKAWGHPDFPPRGVIDFCIKRFQEIEK